MKGFAVFLAACGSSSPKTPDAHVADAAPDVGADATPDAPAIHHVTYVVNQLKWPTSTTDSRDEAFDLDGDGTLDNQFGIAVSQLRNQGGIDAQAPTDVALARGVSITLADVQAPDLGAPSAGFTLYVGTNPTPTPCSSQADTTCGHHLSGSGAFDVAATPHDTPITGPITSSVFVGGPGHLSLPIYPAGGTPALITLLAAHAQFTASADGLTQGKIGGAVAMSDIDGKLIPAMQQGFTASVARDCSDLQSPPRCGCVSGSQGAALISFFDHNNDCVIALTELEQTSLIQSLFAPDVTVEGQMAMSFGCAFTAVDATFTP